MIPDWRILLIIFSLGFASGIYAHHIWDGYKQNAETQIAINNLGKGEAKITAFNQDYDKEIHRAKDNCLDELLPSSIARLLK